MQHRKLPLGSAPFSTGEQRPHTALPAFACDCHIHVYDNRFAAVADATLLPPNASICDYQQLQHRTGLGRAVVVTPSTYGTDNRCMLEGLKALGAQGRGVAVIDGTESDDALTHLHALGVRGARLNLSMGHASGPEAIAPVAERIADWGWHLQVLMPPHWLTPMKDVLSNLPVPLVFDHFARLNPLAFNGHPAHTLILKLLEQERAWIKLSGGYLLCPSHSTQDPSLTALAQSYLKQAPHRVIWGSDWPHPSASAGLQPMPDDARQLDALTQWCVDADTLHQVLVRNPESLYGFEPSSPSV